MLSKPYATPLHLELGRSRSLRRYILILHLLAAALLIAAVLRNSQPLWICLILPALGISAWHALSREANRSHPGAISALTWDSDQQWWLNHRDGAERGPYLLGGENFVSNWLLILRLTPLDGAGRGVRVLIPGDAASREGLRKLRVRLKITRHGTDHP